MDNHLIPDLPAAGYYIPGLVTPEDEQRISNEIYKLPSSRWTGLSHRRLLSLPSQLSGSARDTLIAAPLPPFLTDPIVHRFQAFDLFSNSPHNAPNHVLINEYKAGQGIMPHEDGPAYFPITATVSLNAHTVLNIYEKNEHGERKPNPTWRILQEPRSLLVTIQDMYINTLHEIEELTMDENLGPDTIINWKLLGDPTYYTLGSAVRKTRISLTYRDVLKVAKLGGITKFLNKK